jgi:hypothetical protein
MEDLLNISGPPGHFESIKLCTSHNNPGVTHWGQLLPTHKSQLLNFQKFYKMGVKYGYYFKNKIT